MNCKGNRAYTKGSVMQIVLVKTPIGERVWHLLKEDGDLWLEELPSGVDNAKSSSYLELDQLALKIADGVCKEIVERAPKVKTGRHYKELLGELVSILKDRL